MPLIDVHTHMLSKSFIECMREKASPDYTVGEGRSGPAIFIDGLAELNTNPRMFDYAARIQMMDAEGMDISIVSLTSPSVYWGTAEASNEGAQIINDDMAAAQAEYPDRIRYFASLPWQHPALAVAELKRACNNGAVGVMVLANIRGTALTDPLFWPIWRAIDDRALPVLVHPTQVPGYRELNMKGLKGSIGFTFDTSLNIAKMALDGFFDHYTNLKIIASHAGGTLPYIHARIDLFAANMAEGDRKISEPPSHYLRQIYYDSITYQMDALEMLVNFAGPDRVMFGTDWPHPTDVPGIRGRLDALPSDQTAAIRGANAERIFPL